MNEAEHIRLAVFDCDGTLVDSQHSIIGSMHAGFDGLNMARATDEAVRRVVGLPLLDAIARLVPDASVETVERLRDGYSAAWLEMRDNGGLDEPLYPGTTETLAKLESTGWVLGVATGKGHRGLVGTLEKHDVLDRFQTLQTADRARGKPHPEMLIRAMEETGAEPANTVMIGDTTFDVEMAVAADVMAIGVSWGYHESRELTDAGACTVVNAYGELPALLAEIREKR